MLIGLVSDTHIPAHAKALPPEVQDAFRGVDLILHAGDLFETTVLDDLERIAPVLCAKGDDDVCVDPRIKMKHVLKFDGATIWLAHELPESWGRNGDEYPDVIICGHTHTAMLTRRGKVLIINPGSPTYPDYYPEPGTVGLLKLGSGRPKAKLVYLQPKELGSLALEPPYVW